MGRPHQDQEQDQPFEQGLVQLAGMAGNQAGRAAAVGPLDHRIAEHHAPRQVGGPTPELGVDEIGDPAQEMADRIGRDDHVGDPQQIKLVAPGVEDHGDGHADDATVEAHPAFPGLEDGDRVLPDHGRCVEQHMTQPAAADDADGDPQDQVIHLQGRERRGAVRPEAGVAQQPLGVAPAQQDAGDIGQGIPADRQWPELQGEGPDVDDRLDFGEGHFGGISDVQQAM